MKKLELLETRTCEMVGKLSSWGIPIEQAKKSTMEFECPTCLKQIVPLFGTTLKDIVGNVVGFCAGLPPEHQKSGTCYAIIRQCGKCNEYVWTHIYPENLRVHISSENWPDEIPDP